MDLILIIKTDIATLIFDIHWLYLLHTYIALHTSVFALLKF